MKIFVTKYILTKGILEVEVENTEAGSTSYQTPGHEDRQFFHERVEGKEWHRTYEAARKRAEVVRQAKIKSLEKELARLQKTSFV